MRQALKGRNIVSKTVLSRKSFPHIAMHRQDLIIDYDALGYLVILAASFGFNPKRDEWSKFKGMVQHEGHADSMDGWWIAFRQVNIVTSEEANEMAAALKRARLWFSDSPGVFPPELDQSRAWPWDRVARWASSPESRTVMDGAIAFMESGAFRPIHPKGDANPRLTPLTES